VNIFHHDLEPVEVTGFRDLNLVAESLGYILRYYTVGSCKKGKYVLDEMLLITRKLVPVFSILVQVNFVHSPKGCQVMFVHSPYVLVFDREYNKPARVCI